MTARHVLALLALVAVVGVCTAADPKPFPGTPTKWEGFARHDFKVDGTDATVVVPDKPLPGRPWVWRGGGFRAPPAPPTAPPQTAGRPPCLRTSEPFRPPQPRAP